MCNVLNVLNYIYFYVETMIVAYFQMMNTMGGEDGMPDLGMGGMEGLEEVCVYFLSSKFILQQIYQCTIYGGCKRNYLLSCSVEFSSFDTESHIVFISSTTAMMKVSCDIIFAHG